MDTRIIAFVDGSLYSASVCGHTAWAAERLGTGVVILHVIGRRETRPDPAGLGARSALQAELAALDAQRARLVDHRGRAILDDAADLLRHDGISEVTTDLIHGDLIGTLAEKETSAEMVVIGKRGEAADYAIDHLGSNLERIARATSRPILVASRAFKPIEKVLVAHDGGVAALRAIDHIARSPLFEGLTITVATVGVPSPEIMHRHADALAILRSGGLRAEARILSGQPDVALGQLVDSEGYDFLVMGSYGRSRLRRFFIGSTTASVLLSCRVPVLLLR